MFFCSVLTPYDTISTAANSAASQRAHSVLREEVDIAVSKRLSGTTGNGSGVGSRNRDLLKLQQAKQQELQELRLAYPPSASAAAVSSKTMTVEQWCHCVSLAHAEVSCAIISIYLIVWFLWRFAICYYRFYCA